MKKSVQSRKWDKILAQENNDSIICRNIRCYNVSDASSFMRYLLKCVSEKYQTGTRNTEKKGENRNREKLRECNKQKGGDGKRKKAEKSSGKKKGWKEKGLYKIEFKSFSQ